MSGSPKQVYFRMSAKARQGSLTVVSPIESDRQSEMSFKKMTDAMKSQGVKLLAIDWDLTMVSCHTRSQWYGTPAELGKHVRPVFCKLTRAAMASGIKVVIVSFSCQHSLIQGAVKSAFSTCPSFDTSNIIIRCSDKKWNVCEKQFQQIFPTAKLSSPGKLKHLCSAAQQLCLADKENRLLIQPKDIVLIDDDTENVKSAKNNQVTAVQMDPERPDQFLYTLGDIYLGQNHLCNNLS